MNAVHGLATWQEVIADHARAFGLDFFETRFEMVDYRMMNQLAAYGGFPVRYPHWRFGMEYERLSRSYSYGLHRIYEMVINTDPCYAYLLESNNIVDQKMVMVHVYGHCDFFKNNMWFAHTNRKMLDEMANHASRVRRYMTRYGQDTVEDFIDACLSLDNLIDIHAAGIRRRPDRGEEEAANGKVNGTPALPRFRANEYMDSYVNPREHLVEQERRLLAEQEQQKQFPAQPERDVLLFLMEHAPLEEWQRDIVGMVREEAVYYAPQGQTKIMNEGWATYVHSSLMTRHLLDANEVIDYAEHHAGTVATNGGRLNPYRLGLELFRDIEDRWNRGAFGPEYEACSDLQARRHWDRGLNLGRQKLFEVRRIYNDIGFIEAFLTEEFAQEHKLFAVAYNEKQKQYEIDSREFQRVKRQLLFQLTNFGNPTILIQDANHKNRGELYLAHRHDGVDLDEPYARDTLRNLHVLWGRPVHLETMLKEKNQKIFYHHDKTGSERSQL